MTLRNLKIPENAKFFTMDAISMYTNIDTDHALTTISAFLRKLDIKTINTEAVIHGLTIIMRHNDFKFGDTFWVQQSGTAMGTPPAPTYATLYYAIHEMEFVPNNPNLCFYGRYIDDVVGNWLRESNEIIDSDNWKKFQNETKYGKLTWEFTARSKSIDFLDVNFEIIDQSIETKLFEKAMNLYLYLPPHSAHAPGMIRGLIAGTILRIRRLTSKLETIVPTIKKFYQRLRARGYTKQIIEPIFRESFLKRTPKMARSNESSLFLHLLYHPRDPPSRNIQQHFRDSMLHPPRETPLPKLRNHLGSSFDLDRLTIAYHRHRNIGNILAPRKLNERGTPVSTLHHVRDDMVGAINPNPDAHR